MIPLRPLVFHSLHLSPSGSGTALLITIRKDLNSSFASVGTGGCFFASLAILLEPLRPTCLFSLLTPRMDSVSLQEQPLEPSPTDLPSIKGVLPRDDMCAVPAHEELDPVVEGVQVLLGYRGLCLLNDVQRVRGA